MKSKNLLISGIILIVVVAIIMISENLGSKKSSKKDAFFPGISEEKCSSFIVSDKKGSVKIERKGDKWFVSSLDTKEKEAKDKETEEGKASSLLEETEKKDEEEAEKEDKKDDDEYMEKEYPADSSSIKSVFEKFAKMKMDNLISQNSKKQSVFEVDKDQGIDVEIFDENNKSLGTFKVGKSGPDWSSHYVRMIGSDDVYCVSGSIKYAFFTSEKRWRDKTIVKFSKDMAQKITITKKEEEKPYTLESSVDTAGSKVWNITAPEQAEADKKAVEKMVKVLSNLKCTDWEKDRDLTDQDMGFDEPELTVAVELDNGEKMVLHVGKIKEDGSKRWVRKEGADYTFLVYKSKFNDVDKKLEEIKKKEKDEEEKKEE